MFKRGMSLALALSMLLCLAACGGNASSPGSAESRSAPPAPQSASSSSEPEPDPKTTPEYHSTEAIRERGVMIVGMSGNAKLNYFLPDDPEVYGELAGTCAGYLPELCRRVAEKMDVEVEFVQYDTLAEDLQAVASGDTDLSMGNYAITEERLAVYEMTDRLDVREQGGDEVFLSTRPLPWPERDGEEADSASASASASDAEPELREMVQSEEDLNNVRFGVLEGSIQVKSVAEKYPGAELRELPSNEAILEALVAGEIDACVFTTFNKMFADEIVEAIVAGDVAQCGYMVPTPDFRGNGLILMKGNEDLCETFNAVIAELKESGWLEECYDAQESLAYERGII